MRRRHFISLIFLAAALPCAAKAHEPRLAVLRRLLENPVGYAEAKLIIDGLADPKVEVAWATS